MKSYFCPECGSMFWGDETLRNAPCGAARAPDASPSQFYRCTGELMPTSCKRCGHDVHEPGACITIGPPRYPGNCDCPGDGLNPVTGTDEPDEKPLERL